MLYENMKRESNLNVRQISVDDSPYSIAATQTMLNYKNIPIVATTKEFSRFRTGENSKKVKIFRCSSILRKFQNVFGGEK